MKKRISLAMALGLMCMVPGGMAEEGQTAPLYATVGEALEDCAEGRVIAGGVLGEYYAVVTEKDGQYYRSVADYDERLTELEEAMYDLDFEAEDYFEQYEAAEQAASEYRNRLPIAYSEVFTAQPLTAEEMAALEGKPLSRLTEEGFEVRSSGTENLEEDRISIVYTLRFGVFDYSCVMDTDLEGYLSAQEKEDEGSLTVQSVALVGITEEACSMRFHTDGTVDEIEDPFAEMSALAADIGELLERARSGEEIDLEGFAAMLREKYPDYEEMIDMYVMMYQTFGIEGLASMMESAE